MGIKYQPTGYGETVQKVAQEAGAAVAAREAAKISAQLEAQRESQVRSMEFEKQMKDIDQQFELEKFARSKAWDIEKMETASRIDFEYDEKKRIQKKAEFDARNKSLDEALERDDLDSDDYKKQKELLKLKYFDMDEAAKALYDEDKVMKRLLAQQQMKQPTSIDLERASKGLEELKQREKVWYKPWFMEKRKEETPEGQQLKMAYQEILRKAGATVQSPVNQIPGAENTIGDYPVFDTADEADESLPVGSYWRDRTGQLWQVTQ